MNINEMKVGELLEITKMLGGQKGERKTPFVIGQAVFIRTVTLYYTGIVSALTGGFVTLKDAAWIADTGRFHDFLKEGECNEYEGFIEPVNIPIGSIVDFSEWKHPLFRGQK
jgi:hypothetical protein